MTPASEMKKISDQQEADRLEQRRKKEEEIDPYYVNMLENALTDGANIYWRRVTIRSHHIGKATLEYFRACGYNVEEGRSYVITW